MTIPSVNDILEVVINGEFDGTEDIKNVFHFKVNSFSWATQADFISDLRELVLTVLTVIDGICSIKQLWDSVTWRNLTTNSPATTVSLLSTVPGMVAGEAMPPGTAALAVFRTGTKNVILRKYFGVLGANELASDGQWDSTTAATIAGLITTLLSPITLTNSNVTYGYLRPSTATFVIPASGYAPVEPAYQRRRRRGRGS